MDESGPNAIAQLDKRMRKLAALKEELPEPILYGAKKPDILPDRLGSTKGPILDALEDDAFAKLKIGYLTLPICCR